jgi:hypothetical protein
MKRFRYASSTSALEPSARVSFLPNRPFQVGPTIVRPSMLWQATQP